MEAQSALGIQSGEDLTGIWTGPYTLRAIWPEMGRRALQREERLWATVQRWRENKRDRGKRKDPMASFLPLSLSSLHLTSPIWLLVLGLISTLLMCLTRKFPCSYKWHRRASLLVFNKKETRSCHCHLPMWPKCGASLLPFTDQLGLQVTTSGHAEPPLKSQAWTCHHLALRKAKAKPDSHPFWKCHPSFFHRLSYFHSPPAM